MALALFILIVGLAFAFGVTNGFSNGGGLVATVITTRAMEPIAALTLVAVCEIAGVFLLGHAVAHTISQGIFVVPLGTSSIRMLGVLASAFLGALIWNTCMWRLALPTSTSHAIVGGILGAVLLEYGMQSINWPVVVRIAIFLAVVPVAGVLGAMLLARMMYWMGEFLTPAARMFFRVMQIVTLAGVALVHGSNDGQKTIAMVLMGLAAWKGADATAIEWPLLLTSGVAMALGVVFGSRRIIQTLGKRLYKIQHIQGFCAQAVTLFLVGVSSHMGYPMATSQVLSTSVLGAGMAVQPRDVRWNLVGEIGVAWLVTIPAAAALAAIFTGVMHYVVS